MNLRPLSSSADWRDLYAAALFEDDKSQIAARVAEAELAMLTRENFLFSSSDPNRKEVVELDQSLRMLQLLKTCLLSETEIDQPRDRINGASTPPLASKGPAVHTTGSFLSAE